MSVLLDTRVQFVKIDVLKVPGDWIVKMHVNVMDKSVIILPVNAIARMVPNVTTVVRLVHFYSFFLIKRKLILISSNVKRGNNFIHLTFPVAELQKGLITYIYCLIFLSNQLQHRLLWTFVQLAMSDDL